MKIIKMYNPITGIISHISQNNIIISTINDYNKIFAPITGTITKIHNKINKCKLYIKNDNLDDPLILTIISKNKITILNKINVLAKEHIGIMTDNSIIKINCSIYNNKIVKLHTKILAKKIIGYIFKLNNKNNIHKLQNAMKKLNQSAGTEIVKQLIILTTPHELCDLTIKGHFCDTSAILLSNQLKSSLTNDTNEIIQIHGNINRKQLDLNRYASRNNSEFRNNIREQIQNHSNKVTDQFTINNIIYILDCHSYPFNDNFKDIISQESDITLLFDDTKYFIYNMALVDMLKENNIKTIILPGIKNDIIDEFGDLKIPNVKIIPMLIELNENTNKIQVIGQIFNEWINKVNAYIIANIKTKKL